MTKLLFGIPFYKGKINSLLYDKQKIISDIESNYHKSPTRNNWGYNGDLHHSFNDDNNENFIKINYEKLIPLYKEKIDDFFGDLKFKKKINFEYKIENYTATKNSQYMGYHQHLPSTFFAIHYLQFDPKIHNPTQYKNSHVFADYLPNLRGNLTEIFDESYLENSWVTPEYWLSIEEDDFIIMPSLISHSIFPCLSNEKTRISVALNINISTD
jgi:hypothetical protein